MDSYIRARQGFTLIELMTVVAILSILAMFALVLYDRSVEKAKSAEAEIALAELARLEQLYYSNKEVYSDNLNAIGFSPVPALKYYRIEAYIFNGGASYQARALPLISSGNPMARVLTRTPDGQMTLISVDPTALPVPMGALSGGNDNATPVAGGGAGATPSLGSGQPNADCQTATLAADGRIDMNFCFKSINESKK